MQVTQEKRSGSQVGLTITLDADQVQQTYEKTVRHLMRNLQIQGFRKGKAPRKMVIQYLGSTRIKAAALEELLNDSVKAAIEDSAIEAVGQFELEGGIDGLLETFNPQAELSFSGTIDVQPEVQLGSYKGLDIQVARVEFDPQRVEDTLDSYRQQRATLLPVEDRAAQLGDVAVLDFVGRTLEGEEIEGAKASEFQIELEEAKFIPGFVAGIAGMSVGETREIEAEFPEDYANAEVAGQKAQFTVTLQDLKTKELPPLDDEFAQSISEFQSLDALRQHFSNTFTQEVERESLEKLDEALVEAVLKDTEIDLPETLIEGEVKFLIKQSVAQLSQQGIDVNQFLTQELIQRMQEQSRPEAIARLRRTLALGEIVRREGIEVGQTELQIKVEDFLRNYRGKEKLNLQRVQEYFREELLTTKVFSWLKEQNTIAWVDADGNPVDAPGSALVGQSAQTEEVVEDASTATVEIDAQPDTADSESGKEAS
jgi:trigger factor